jgi:hypothetical protein
MATRDVKGWPLEEMGVERAGGLEGKSWKNVTIWVSPVLQKIASKC